MTEVASRGLRNQTRALLDRVTAGEQITITVDGKPVARLVPAEPRPRWMPRTLFAARVLHAQADPGLTAELKALAPDTTDTVVWRRTGPWRTRRSRSIVSLDQFTRLS